MPGVQQVTPVWEAVAGVLFHLDPSVWDRHVECICSGQREGLLDAGAGTP